MSQRVDYEHLPTEQPNPKGRALDRMSLERILIFFLGVITI